MFKKNITILTILLPLANISFSAPNTISRIYAGKVISVNDEDKIVVAEMNDGKRQNIKIKNILNKDTKKKIQAGSTVQFYVNISQER